MVFQMQLPRRIFVIAGIGATFTAVSAISGIAQESVGTGAPSASTTIESIQSGVDLIRLAPLPQSHRHPVVTAMAVHQGTNTMAAAGDDHAVRWIDLETGKTLATLEGHVDWVRQITFLNPQGPGLQLLSCGDDGKVYLWSWDVTTTPPAVTRKTILDCDHTLYCMSLDPAQQLLAAGGFSNEIHVVDLVQPDKSKTFKCDCGDQRAFVFAKDSKNLFVGGRDGAIHVVDLVAGKIVHDRQVHRSRLRSLALNSEGDVLTSVGEDRFVNRILWQTGTSLMTTRLAAGKLLAVEPLDEARLAIASADNTVQIISSATGEPIKQLIGHDGSVAVLLYVNNRLFTTGYDTTIRIWDLEKVQTPDREPKLIRHSTHSKFFDSGVNEITN